jgi:hypothetical protein
LGRNDTVDHDLGIIALNVIDEIEVKAVAPRATKPLKRTFGIILL